ncbi:cold shock domain-containing protein [Candidatus Phytoplasma rubi]|uniref:Cold shock domain-containing protein n=1 Tax=Candidatus Phytoplasma rubi TaxID=399025 RepID=A0ABY7BRB7_9MOLU|nr:cold shock domain-containing protein [Candidatus Phytoplasma rubi]WAN63248.1 cold shock domain-containing protein [Candidatus Phytoplasma rubi]
MEKQTKVKWQGITKWFNTNKSFGFIKGVTPIGEIPFNEIAEQFEVDNSEIEQLVDKREREEDDLFCHANNIVQGNTKPLPGHYQNSRYKKLEENDKVEFFIKLVNGREQACFIVLV